MSKIIERFQLFIMISAVLLPVLIAGSVYASDLVPQTWLPGKNLFPTIGFTVPLPVFGPAGNIPRVDVLQHPNITVTMKEIDQQVLPPPYKPTRVWVYEIKDSTTGDLLAPANWPAVTIEARRLTSTTVTYVNQLPSFGDPIMINGNSTTGLVQGLITVDQTIHWADPLNSPNMNPCTDNPLASGCSQPFIAPPPATVHLHGGETPSAFDGGPESWFTPDGKTGPGYNTLFDAGPSKAVYQYPNFQEPGTLFFHDHALGATRDNVYSGLVGFYFIRDPKKEPKDLPSGAYEIEMAIQDRQFDTNGQLFFPDGSGQLCGSGDPLDPCLNGGPPNPDIHPFWIPEFIGDVAIVNGAPWPYLNVQPRRYRFRLVDGSNARMYNLRFGDPVSDTNAPVYIIGADDNYLDAPVPVNMVFIAPGERADVIVDFTDLAGKIVMLTNDAPVPFPSGLVPGVDQPAMTNIMQFRVSAAQVNDKSCNPAAGQCRRRTPLVRLTDGQGHLARGVKIDKVRQIVLKEVERDVIPPGGPLEVLVNNTKWDGLRSPSIAAIFPTDGVSELPRVGSTELWEIINLTEDAHPMHTHLTQFQILNREPFDIIWYSAAWEGAFGSPGTAPLLPSCLPGQFCAGYGPPLPYNVPNADGAIGGNPAIGPYLTGLKTPPAPLESGWKDTAKAMPGEVLRIVVRWAPTYQRRSHTGQNFYPFDPTKGPGYVWHCHILDHEDNEMMRPYKVTK